MRLYVHQEQTTSKLFPRESCRSAIDESCTQFNHHREVQRCEQNYTLSNEVTTRGPWRVCTLYDRIWIHNKCPSGKERVDILWCLSDVSLDIHGEARRLWNCETEVEGERCRNTAEANDDAPAKVNMNGICWSVSTDTLFVRSNDDHGYEGCRQLTWDEDG